MVVGTGFGQRKYVFVFHRADVFEKTFRNLFVGCVEFRINLFRASRTLFKVGGVFAVQNRVVVFCKFFQKVFEVAAVKAHMVDDHRKRRFPVLVQDNHLKLYVA